MKEEMFKLYNHFFKTGNIPSTQKLGVILCLPKYTAVNRVKDYRPLTLLNTDHKIYSRILANGLKPTLRTIIHDSQYSAIPERNIIDAASAIRDIIAAGTDTRYGICLMVLDFARAFDKISHTYMKRMLTKYNYGHKISTAILSLYENAKSCIAINGHCTNNLEINCSIRQGCPRSSILYALTLNPFLHLINKHLKGLEIGPDKRKVTCVAYADDVTVILTDPTDVRKLQHILHVYEQATGATLNWDKTSGVLFGRWDTTQDIGGARYTETAKILGIHFGTNIGETIDNTWKDKVQKVRQCVNNNNLRKMDINQRMQCCNIWFLSKIWYAAQIIPISNKYAQQLTTSITQYIWSGWIFRVPAST
jgi:hypothetical protein